MAGGDRSDAATAGHPAPDRHPGAPPANRVRVNVSPGGGLGRLRLYRELNERGMEDLALRRFNALPDPKAEDELLALCGSRRWATEMALWRPFTRLDQARDLAVQVWNELTQEDRVDALHNGQSFDGESDHPGQRFDIDPGELEILAKAQRVYQQRFGFAFLTDPGSTDRPGLLDQIRGRLGNDPRREMRTALEEHLALTLARLSALLRPELWRRVDLSS